MSADTTSILYKIGKAISDAVKRIVALETEIDGGYYQ